MQSGYVEISGGRLYYEVAGSGDPLVLIHGLALDTRMWDDQFEEFAKFFRVIRYDVRGFGKSSLPTGESFAHADDLKTLLAHLDITNACICGLSMGGWIATNFALTYPEMTRSLILVSPALIGYHWSDEWRTLWRQVAEGADVDPKAANKRWLEHPLFELARENPNVAARLTKIVMDYTGWGWSHSDGHLSIEPPDSERLNQIKVPTLISVGEHDIPDFHSIADILERGILHVSKVTFPESGHMVNMEAPSAFNALVEQFLLNDHRLYNAPKSDQD